MKIITTANRKGGPGKTTFNFNLSGMLAETHRVLLMDFDPQANLTFNVGIDVTQSDLKTVKDIFEGNPKPQEIIYKNPIEGLSNLGIKTVFGD